MRSPGTVLVTGLACVALALAASACGVPTSSSPQVVASVPAALTAKPRTFHKTQPPPCNPSLGTSCVTTDLYFVEEGTDHLVAVPTKAKTPSALLKALIAGPTPDDEFNGIVTLIPPGAQASIVSIRRNVVSVELSASFGNMSLAEIAQIVWTLSVHPITGVLFYQFGGPVYVRTQNQVYAVDPVGPADYSSFRPGA